MRAVRARNASPSPAAGSSRSVGGRLRRSDVSTFGVVAASLRRLSSVNSSKKILPASSSRSVPSAPASAWFAKTTRPCASNTPRPGSPRGRVADVHCAAETGRSARVLLFRAAARRSGKHPPTRVHHQPKPTGLSSTEQRRLRQRLDRFQGGRRRRAEPRFQQGDADDCHAAHRTPSQPAATRQMPSRGGMAGLPIRPCKALNETR